MYTCGNQFCPNIIITERFEDKISCLKYSLFVLIIEAYSDVDCCNPFLKRIINLYANDASFQQEPL